MVASKSQRTRAPESANMEDDGILRIGETAEAPVYKELFKLDGVAYEVLDNPPASLMLEYFDRMRRSGTNLAFSWLLEEMLGEGAYDALKASPKVSSADFRQVCDLILGIVLGRPETVPKSPRNGSRRTGG